MTECHLPPTFQSWFTVTNLHVWILTTRLRALPASYAQTHIQGLIDHFFLDVEDRIRQVLQPQSQLPPRKPAAAPTTSSTTASTPSTSFDGTTPTPGTQNGAQKRGRAPEALVTKQMKVFREQWAGLGVALDLALAQDSDAAMAG